MVQNLDFSEAVILHIIAGRDLLAEKIRLGAIVEFQNSENENFVKKKTKKNTSQIWAIGSYNAFQKRTSNTFDPN